MNLLKLEIVERISKIIELKDMVIVRYRSEFFKGNYFYKIYFKTGGHIIAGSYSILLDIIAIYRVFNR